MVHLPVPVPFPGMGFTGARGDGATGTDLREGVYMCVSAVVGL